MHLQDENVNHAHENHEHHEHCHAHEHTHDCANCNKSEEDCIKEAVALLRYMKNHNEQHALELKNMSANIEKMGFGEVSEQINGAVDNFDNGNLRLAVALSILEEQTGEV